MFSENAQMLLGREKKKERDREWLYGEREKKKKVPADAFVYEGKQKMYKKQYLFKT